MKLLFGNTDHTVEQTVKVTTGQAKKARGRKPEGIHPGHIGLGRMFSRAGGAEGSQAKVSKPP